MKTKSVQMPVLALALLFLSFFSVIAQDEADWSHTPFEIKQMDPVNAIVLRTQCKVAEIGPKMEELYGQLFAFMGENEISPAGAPFTVYYTWDPEGMTEFEVGMPVAEKTAEDESIKYKEFDSQKAVVTKFTGAYEDMEIVYEELMKYMEEEKLESQGTAWEVYLTDPSKVEDPSMNQTLIYFTLK